MDREIGLIALHLTPGSTSLLRKQLAEGEENMRLSLTIKEPTAYYNPQTSYLVERAKSNWPRAEEILAEFKRKGIAVIPSNDARYPPRLKEVGGGFPPLLYAMGNVELLKRLSIAICGSRHASADGLRHAEAFGKVAAQSELCVVSGYARGVDNSAHLGALCASGCTVIVLAEGILHFRLKSSLRDAERFWDNTVVISQFPPEQPWRIYAAMERNKVICGLACGLVVVEAHERGGTIAAGRECLRQGKPLWVIQHSVPSEDCMGNTVLLGQGGIGIRSTRELRSALAPLSQGLQMDL